MQQRYYDPQIGRFLSIDPAATNAGVGFNRYWYANGNPYRFTDPDGRKTECSQSVCTMSSDSFTKGKSNGITGKPVAAATESVEKNKGMLQQRARGGKEPQAWVVLGKGGAEFKIDRGSTPGTKGLAKTVGSTPPDGSIVLAGAHGHTQDSFVDKPEANKGYGDTESLKWGIPYFTVTSGGDVGVHQIDQGQLQFVFPQGSMDDTESQQMQINLNNEQKLHDLP